MTDDDLKAIRERLGELPYDAYGLSLRNEIAEDAAVLLAEVERLRAKLTDPGPYWHK